MTDEGKLRLQQDRGVRAKSILEHELVIEAFDKIEKTISESWKHSGADGAEVRERAYLMHRLLGNFKEHFRQIVVTGGHAGKELLRTENETKLRRLVNGRR